MQTNVRFLLYATVFLTGAAVLIIEVGAVRLLSPYFGSSLYVLSSVLTTILAALSFGYYIGGKFSDRFPFHEPLYRVITLSGIFTLLLLYVSLRALPAAGSILSVTFGPLIFSLLFFFLPAFFLGMVSPYIIKLHALTTPSDQIGTVVGATFFWGTVGSIVGSLASGFYLIPFVGVIESLGITGIVLVFLGLFGDVFLRCAREGMGGLKEIGSKRLIYTLSVVLVALILWRLISVYVPESEYEILYEDEGLYSHILIYERQHLGKRMHGLKRDTNNSSASYVNFDGFVFGYTNFATLYDKLIPDVHSFLLIGGGAYSIPRTLTSFDSDLFIDVVEIEPELFPLAQKYFGLTDLDRINNYVMDGRVFLSQSTTTYDVIFGDAFGTDLGVPNHLATEEFFREVKAHLSPDGIFMMNAVGKLYQEPLSLTGSLIKTIQTVFPNLKVYAFNKAHPNVMQNIVFVARKSDMPINLEGARISATNGELLSVSSLEIDFTDFVLTDELILTDNRAPLEYLMVRQR